MKRWLASGVGLLIGLVGLAFVSRTLLRERETVVAAASVVDPRLAVLAVLVALTGMLQIGLAWRRTLAIVGVHRPVVDTLFRYFVGQLGKYVPGGIWPVVGRAEMARRGGVNAGAAYSSTMLSLATTYLAAILLVLVLLPFGFDGQGGTLAVLILLPLGVVGLHPTVIGWALDLLERMSKKRPAVLIPSWGTSVRLLVRHVPAWLSIGIATWLVAFMLGESGELSNVLLATALSWVVGFVAIPVPGGIGVREAVFVAAASSLSPGIAATTALVSRLVFIIVDVGGAAATAAYVQGRTARRTRI